MSRRSSTDSCSNTQCVAHRTHGRCTPLEAQSKVHCSRQQHEQYLNGRQWVKDASGECCQGVGVQSPASCNTSESWCCTGACLKEQCKWPGHRPVVAAKSVEGIDPARAARNTQQSTGERHTTYIVVTEPGTPSKAPAAMAVSPLQPKSSDWAPDATPEHDKSTVPFFVHPVCNAADTSVAWQSKTARPIHCNHVRCLNDRLIVLRQDVAAGLV